MRLFRNCITFVGWKQPSDAQAAGLMKAYMMPKDIFIVSVDYRSS